MRNKKQNSDKCIRQKKNINEDVCLKYFHIARMIGLQWLSLFLPNFAWHSRNRANTNIRAFEKSSRCELPNTSEHYQWYHNVIVARKLSKRCEATRLDSSKLLSRQRSRYMRANRYACAGACTMMHSEYDVRAHLQAILILCPILNCIPIVDLQSFRIVSAHS